MSNSNSGIDKNTILDETYKQAIIDKNQWLGGFKKRFKKSYCKEDTPIRECYSISLRQCEQNIDKNWNLCQNSLKLKDKIDLVLEGPGYAEKLGQCLGQKFAIEMEPLRLKTDKCLEGNTWQN